MEFATLDYSGRSYRLTVAGLAGPHQRRSAFPVLTFLVFGVRDVSSFDRIVCSIAHQSPLC
jgi:hypothetical protein